MPHVEQEDPESRSTWSQIIFLSVRVFLSCVLILSRDIHIGIVYVLYLNRNIRKYLTLTQFMSEESHKNQMTWHPSSWTYAGRSGCPYWVDIVWSVYVDIVWSVYSFMPKTLAYPYRSDYVVGLPPSISSSEIITVNDSELLHREITFAGVRRERMI